MKIVNVKTNKPYDIFIEKDQIENCGALIKKNVPHALKAAVITDGNVAALYLDKLIYSLSQNGYETSYYIFEAGESSKNLNTVENIYNHLSKQGITRKDLLIALGGGVTGDITGFAAATYLRGIDFIQIPTSLLAQTDSSVGGKTGVDTKYGKNLVGAFHQPRMVIIDPNTLLTLPEKYFYDGIAEIIKYGCIKSLNLFEKLENENIMDIIEDIIFECVSIKSDIVSRDEFESGQRMLLNFGHTLGHALEKTYNFQILSHGEAVAVGMVLVTGATELAGLTEPGTTARLISLCKKYHLPVQDNTGLEILIQAAANDKKTYGNIINLIIIERVGYSTVKKMTFDQFRRLLLKEGA